ncbi:hypothetical protein GCM10011515_23800 [Tsuneonella deserti]|uniref:Transposase n=1 Tax=Tsuneonella deserti TaxID=2035528 RepID=A0ABQ1SCN7_9SPHN|nr:hypothetical protein [Tsuneonella deserti]GGE03450.1 hypothetical protein GCM10011515_23800 [Tsuneonella deserti]
MRRLAAGVRVVTACAETARLVTFYGQYRTPDLAMPVTPWNAADRLPDPITGFLTAFRRGMQLQHQSVSPRYFWLFLKEYEFRFNRRARSSEIFGDMIGHFPSVGDETIASLRAAYCDLREQ